MDTKNKAVSDALADGIEEIAAQVFKITRELCGDRLPLVCAVTRRVNRWAEYSETAQLVHWDESRHAAKEPTNTAEKE